MRGWRHLLSPMPSYTTAGALRSGLVRAWGLFAGLVWFLVARDTPAQHPWSSQDEQRYIAAGLPRGDHITGAPQLGWGEIVKDRNVQALSFSYFTYGYAVYIFFSWFFIYLNSVRGLDMKKSSLYTMLPFIAMAVASPIGGWLSDRITRSKGKRAGRCGLAAAAMAFCGAFLLQGLKSTAWALPLSCWRAVRALFIFRRARSGLSVRTSVALRRGPYRAS